MSSVVLLTTHKAASSFLARRLLPQLAAAAGFEWRNPDAETWRDGGGGVIDSLAARRDLVLGPVREPKSIADPQVFDGWRKLMVLRDPRDVLTSYYFSISQSHGLPPSGPLRERMLANRALAQAETVDDCAVRLAPMVAKRYRQWRERFAAAPNLHLARYEQLVTDWDGFAAGVADFLGAPWGPDFWDEVRPPADEFQVPSENPGAHKRQVLPGDHRRKLQAETIAALDQMLAPSLSWLGYEFGSDIRSAGDAAAGG